MKNHDKVKQIVQALQTLKKDKLSREEIERTIAVTLCLKDPRSLDTWLMLIWRLGYLEKTKTGIYQLLKIVCE